MRFHGGNSASALWHSASKRRKTDARADRAAPALLYRSVAVSSATDSPANSTGTQPAPPKPRLPGFRHFIKAPDIAQQFTLDGMPFDPSSPDSWMRGEYLMGKLAALCMVPPLDPKDGVNRDLPSGYSYFLQLIAHDLVHSSVLLSRSQDRLFGLANIRNMPLRLETVYGGGPAHCPGIYQ